MEKKRSGLIITTVALLVIMSCKKTTTYNAPPLTDYFITLQVGKYITYRMDSLTFYYYGQSDTVTSYLAKDSVEGTITDNLGRPGWRIVRYLSDTTGTAPWTPTESYMVIPTTGTIEVVENNLRFLKLTFPVIENNSWTGNTYQAYNPYQDLFLFSSTENLNPAAWNYTYQNVNKPFTVSNNIQYDSTATVLEVADSSNVPIYDPSTFASDTYWSEVYAKNIGMIYRRTQMWEYQAPTPDGLQSGYKIGFELTLSIVDHN